MADPPPTLAPCKRRAVGNGTPPRHDPCRSKGTCPPLHTDRTVFVKRTAMALTLLILAMAAAAPARVPGESEAVREVSATESRRVEILDAMARAHGGSERLREVRGLRMEGTMQAADGGAGTFVRVSRGPGSLATLTELPGRTEIRILADANGWRGTSHDGLEPVNGPLLLAMQMQSARLLAPLLLDAFRERVRIVEDGGTGPLLEMDLGNGAALLARLDPQSHRVTWTESRMELQGMVLTFATRYGDFRDVSGVMLAHREENSAQGVETATLRVTRLLLNPEARDLLLVPAEGLGGPDLKGPEK